MSLSARTRAQAKVNLLLRVLGRETSGYHSIETVFLRIDLSDDVAVRITPGTRTLDSSGPTAAKNGWPAEQDLAFRAARTYADATGWPAGFEIEVVKRIPVGAGLGGGSADAGAVLRALDALSPKPLGDRLVELAASIGSDVPFMAMDVPLALAWGRGERLLALQALPPRPVLIAMPATGISTADAYRWLDDERGDDVPQARAFTTGSFASWRSIAPIACNDFEPVVRRRAPEIGTILDGWRGAGADIAMLSGSGSASFALFPGAVPAADIARVAEATLIETETSNRVVRVEVNR